MKDIKQNSKLRCGYYIEALRKMFYLLDNKINCKVFLMTYKRPTKFVNTYFLKVGIFFFFLQLDT